MGMTEEHLKKLQAKSDSLSKSMDPKTRKRLSAEIDSMMKPPPSIEHKSARKKSLLSRIFNKKKNDPIMDIEKSVGEKMRGSIRDGAGRKADSLGIMQKELGKRIDSEKHIPTRNKMIKKEVEVSEELKKIRGF